MGPPACHCIYPQSRWTYCTSIGCYLHGAPTAIRTPADLRTSKHHRSTDVCAIDCLIYTMACGVLLCKQVMLFYMHSALPAIRALQAAPRQRSVEARQSALSIADTTHFKVKSCGALLCEGMSALSIA